MAKLIIEQCPETGICSIVKEDGVKVDLMPNEAADIREAAGDAEKIKAVIGEADSSFADGLEASELSEIAEEIK